MSINARFQRGAVMAIVAMLVLLPLAALAAPPDTARPKSFLAPPVDEEGQPIPKRATVHSVAPTDQQRDLEALKAEVQRLRAQADMCAANLDKAVAQLK